MSENDPFEEPTDPTIMLVIDSYDFQEDGSLVIPASVEWIMAKATIRRAGMGGDDYDSDSVEEYAKLLPDLGLVIVMPHARAEVAANGDSLCVLEYVAERFGRSVELAAYNLMVKHGDTVQLYREANAPVKQKSGMTGKRPPIEKSEEPKGEVL